MTISIFATVDSSPEFAIALNQSTIREFNRKMQMANCLIFGFHGISQVLRLKDLDPFKNPYL